MLSYFHSLKNKEEKIELPYDPAISLLSIYPEKIIIWKDICTLMFIVALFTIAKTWKQPKCLSTEGWKKTIGYVCVCTHACAHAHTLTHTHIMEYYSAMKMNKIMPFAVTWRDLEIIILSQTEKNKYYMTSLLHGISFFKKIQMKLIYKIETDLQISKRNFWL